MSEVHLWAPWPLFLLQLSWLLVPAAHPLKRTLDTNPLTFVSLGPSKPWPLDQQTLPSEFPSFEEEASAPPEYAPKEGEPSPTLQEAPTLTLEAPEKHVAVDPQNFARTKPPVWQKGPALDGGVTVTPEPGVEAEPTAGLQLTAAPPEHPKATPPHPEPAHQRPILRTTTARSLGRGVTITPEPGVEAEPSAGLQLTAAPPENPKATPPHPEPVQAQQPALRSEVSRSQQPESSEARPPLTETPVDICELCTCQGQTLSCVDLDPKQKLRRVPVPDPNTSSGTFTTLNLKGNSISFINEESWEPFHQIETLILSVNDLKELKKQSLIGLPSLRYLDLSCNKISHIDRNAFEETPLLEYINLGCNSLRTLRIGTFQASHGMPFLHTILLDQNPLTTIEDPYFFKLPTLKYLDLGTTLLSLSTVERILMVTHELEKLILPHGLSYCLCLFKKNIEAVSKTVTLQCDNQRLVYAPCDEQLPTGGTGGSFMRVLRRREKKTRPQLTIEPEKAPSDKSGNNLAAYMSLLSEMPSEQQNAKVPKADWDMGQWGNERTDVQEEQEEESSELKSEDSGYARDKALVIAVLIAEAGVACILLLAFIVICCRPSNESKEGSSRGILPIVGHTRGSREYDMKEGDFWSRQPLWLRDLYQPISPQQMKNMALKLHDKDELFDKMEHGEHSPTITWIARSGLPIEEWLKRVPVHHHQVNLSSGYDLSMEDHLFLPSSQ